MLTRSQISELRRLGDDGAQFSESLRLALDEIEAQRPIVLAALNCTDEDGHDGVNTLCVAAEEYLKKLATDDARWLSKYETVNIDRAVY
jgi:hypothetical protein